MGALATLTIPLRLRTSNDRYDAAQILESVAGSEDVSISGGGRAARSYAGNIDSIIGKLDAKKLLGTGPVRVRLPMRSLAIPDKPANPAAMLAEVRESPLMGNAHFDGDRFEANIVPSTGAMLLIYEGAIRHGLMPQDVPTLVALRGLLAARQRPARSRRPNGWRPGRPERPVHLGEGNRCSTLGSN